MAARLAIQALQVTRREPDLIVEPDGTSCAAHPLVSRLTSVPLSGYPGLATRNSAVDNFIAERRAEAAQGCGLNMTPIVFVASATLARYVVQLAMG